MKNYHFFLGGNDLEMEAVRRLLHYRKIPPECIHDKRLGWGARLSDYRDELERLPEGAVPVLLELEIDLRPPDTGIVILDHHGESAGRDQPTALEQLWRLLEMPADLWGKKEFEDFPLIAANDRGHIAAMRRLGASDEQIAAIRARDRLAQGITEIQENQAEAAVDERRTVAGGALTIVNLPHDKTATVTDRLHGKYENLLVLSPEEINFFGEGRWIHLLDKRFPGGWRGGELPETGYWGHGIDRKTRPPVVEQTLVAAIAQNRQSASDGPRSSQKLADPRGRR